jgi:adenylosuccinate lyase
MTRDTAQLEAELSARNDALVAERIGRLAAERGLSREQAHDIHGRVMKAARQRALLPHRDLSLVDTLFGMVAEDATATHLFTPVESAPPPSPLGKGLGEMTMAEYVAARRAGRAR